MTSSTYPQGASCLVQVTPHDFQVLSQAAAKLERVDKMISLCQKQEATLQQRLSEVELREEAVKAREELLKDREDAITRREFQLKVRETSISSSQYTSAKDREDEFERQDFHLNALEKKAQSTNAQPEEVIGDNQQIKANMARIRQDFKSVVHEQMAQSTSSRTDSRSASDREIKGLKSDLEAQKSQLKAREARIERQEAHLKSREQQQQDQHESHNRIMAKYEAAQDARQLILDALKARIQADLDVLEAKVLQAQPVNTPQPCIKANLAIDETLDLVNTLIEQHKKHEHLHGLPKQDKCQSQPSSEYQMFDPNGSFAVDWAAALRQHKRDLHQ